MQNETILTPSKKKHVLMLLGSALFVCAGFFILSRQSKSSDAWVAYSSIGFFGLCALVFVAQLVPGCSYLVIRKDGFEFKALWRGTRLLWSDVDEFGLAEFTLYHIGIPQKHRMVGFRFSPSYKKGSYSNLRRLNEDLVGYEAALPDSYGMKHEDLVSLLTQKKKEYERRG